MKKILLVLGIVGIMVGCGNKVELTTKEYKEELIKKVLNDDKEAIKKYDEITSKLKDQVKAGKEEATRELERWDSVKSKEKARLLFTPSEEEQEEVRRIREKYGN